MSSNDWNNFERDLKKQVEAAVNKDLKKLAADLRRNPRKYAMDQSPWQPDPVTGVVPPPTNVEVIVPTFKLK